MNNSVAAVVSAATLLAVLSLQADDAPKPYPGSAGRAVWDRVRFLPAPGHERDMLGGKFCGSNASATEGYEVLAEISSVPAAGEWAELTFDGRRPHRWIRYEAPPGSFGHIAKLEFYADQRRLGGPGFGSIGRKSPGRDWPRVFDQRPDVWFESDKPDGQYVGIDTLDAATAVRPEFDPPPADVAAAVTVAIQTPTPGARIRYTLDGTTPTAENGQDYRQPIAVERTTTITAAAFLDGFAPSPPNAGTWLVGDPLQPELHTFHTGNSITATTVDFAKYPRTAGYRHHYEKLLRPGILTSQLWEKHVAVNDSDWLKVWESLGHIDHFTVQPRQMDVAEEAKYELLFFDLVRKKSPDVQPWLYAEWTDLYRTHPTNQGTVPKPSSQMNQLLPALTWEESASAWLLYVEEVQRRVLASHKDGKRPRIIPSTLAAGWIKNKVDRGEIPGLSADAFYQLMFFDSVHPGRDGAYLVDLTWFAAFYRQSPEGRVLPIGTTFNAEQARAIERLAWDVVQNYPDCGLYQEGAAPAGEPRFSPSAGSISVVKPVTLSSSTPGTWFRYTLDGTEPTRTRGYVYCGVVSVRPGMTLKAIAYKSGMADSKVVEAKF